MPFVLDKQWILSIRFDRLIAYKPTEVTNLKFRFSCDLPEVLLVIRNKHPLQVCRFFVATQVVGNESTVLF